MKLSIQLILCLACLIVFKMPFTSAQLSLTEDGARVEVNFNSTLKAKDIEKIKSDLAARGIELNYVFTNYDRKGYLRDIRFEVDSKDYVSGSASTKGLTRNSRFGFFIDYRKGADIAFRSGSLE